MTNKLTLQETALLLLKNGFPLEIIPGKTQKSIRHHVLVANGIIPDFYIVFGDAEHGSLLDSAWATARNGEKIRLKEADVRALIEKPAALERWTREMPAAPDSVRLPFTVKNSDLAHIADSGVVVGTGENGPIVKVQELGYVASEIKEGFIPEPILCSEAVVELETDQRFSIGDKISFKGTFRFPDRITEVEIF
jgi:hypothetical protein